MSVSRARRWREVGVATVQFEARDGDKAYNLRRMRELASSAARVKDTDSAPRASDADGAGAGDSSRVSDTGDGGGGGEAKDTPTQLVVFHEGCITGYSFIQDLSFDELLGLAEQVPDGPSVGALSAMARELGVAIGAGLLERDNSGAAEPSSASPDTTAHSIVRRSSDVAADGSSGASGSVSRGKPRIYNTYVVVDASGAVVGTQRKLQPFVSPHVSAGTSYSIFDLLGVRMSILICYDNNLCENARCAALLGAEVLLAPHVTGGTESTQFGRGKIDRALWERRVVDPVPLRAECRSLKGREWILRFLPCRAWENGMYIVFANAVGVDHDTIKPGCAMVIDPCGNVVSECEQLGDGYARAVLSADALSVASGPRYIRARRPDMYAKLVEAQEGGSVTQPAWARSWESAAAGKVTGPAVDGAGPASSR